MLSARRRSSTDSSGAPAITPVAAHTSASATTPSRICLAHLTPRTPTCQLRAHRHTCSPGGWRLRCCFPSFVICSIIVSLALLFLVVLFFFFLVRKVDQVADIVARANERLQPQLIPGQHGCPHSGRYSGADQRL